MPPPFPSATRRVHDDVKVLRGTVITIYILSCLLASSVHWRRCYASMKNASVLLPTYCCTVDSTMMCTFAEG